MTKEEIIECLKTLKKSINETVRNRSQEEFTYIANVKPSSAEFVIQSAIKKLEQEPCEDAVSRQAILDKIKEVYFSNKQEWIDFRISQGSNGQRNFIIDFIKFLPSVTPKQTEVLDKIKAEIEKMPTDYCGGYIGLDKKEVLQIIDKYRVESI